MKSIVRFSLALVEGRFLKPGGAQDRVAFIPPRGRYFSTGHIYIAPTQDFKSTRFLCLQTSQDSYSRTNLSYFQFHWQKNPGRGYLF